MSDKQHDLKNENGSANQKPAKPSYNEPQPGPWGVTREWVDTLVFAYLLAMFIRTFAVELYKIPTGSMTPALVGDQISPIYEGDIDGNGFDDLVVRGPGSSYQVFPHNGERYEGYDEINQLPTLFESRAKPKGFRCDRIIVNKLAYLFSAPKRGDIAVFKVPEKEWSAEKPIYVKRVVAFGGEVVDVELENFNRRRRNH